MDIFLTFDYELYFGEKSGTAAKCLLEPTNRLINIAEKHGVKMTFFVDCGYLIALKKYSLDYIVLKNDYAAVVLQLERLVALGHDCQLHIHPHWEDSYFDGKKWVMDTKRYKLADFTEDEILTIFQKYKKCLEEITGKVSEVYRAGGWCLQPFSKIYKSFLTSGIKIDSTVFLNGYTNNQAHYFDFRKAPLKESWRFSNDLCVEDGQGSFMEVPISSMRYTPFFFFNLFGRGKVNPTIHKPIGNGIPISSSGSKWTYLSSYSNLPVSSDGYFASMLNRAYLLLQKKSFTKMVVIGHPKACTPYSLEALESFIISKKDKNKFPPMSALL